MTPVVFCTVSAVTTPHGRPPSSLTTRTSATRPAPPDGSSPAHTRTSGARVSAAARYGLMAQPTSLESSETGDILADDQRVDVVGSFVGEDALQVQHVAS